MANPNLDEVLRQCEEKFRNGTKEVKPNGTPIPINEGALTEFKKRFKVPFERELQNKDSWGKAKVNVLATSVALGILAAVSANAKKGKQITAENLNEAFDLVKDCPQGLIDDDVAIVRKWCV